MSYLQTIGGDLSTLQAYGIAAVAFVLVPLALAGGASLFMLRRG